MTEFLTAALGFILAMLALGLVRILLGPGDADRMMVGTADRNWRHCGIAASRRGDWRARDGRRGVDARAPRHLRFHRLRQEGEPAARKRRRRQADGGRMSVALSIVTIIAVSAGAFFFLAGTVGLLRFPDTLTRLHALTKADNLGLGLVVLGLLPQAVSLRDGLKLVCVWLLVLLAGATVSQLIAALASDASGQRGESIERGPP